MNDAFIEFQHRNIEEGIQSLSENIKMLLYKNDATIFDRIDFDNDRIYLEPLLFAYFNNNCGNEIKLETILYGYTKPELRPTEVQVKSDEFGRIYLPNIGWLKINLPNYECIFSFKNGTPQISSHLEQQFDIEFEPIEYIKNTQVEWLKYPLPLLKQVYIDEYKNLINVEIELIAKKHRKHLFKAWNLIKRHVPRHFELIQKATRSCVVFNVNTYLRNSFATIAAQGICFLNAYQENYNEVFFVDDIAHQTGHLIFNLLICKVDDFIAINPETVLHTSDLGNNRSENRSVNILFHALYTYYTTFICLDACLDADMFHGNKKHEALARIKFYIIKCHNDIFLIENASKHHKTSQDLFTEKGYEIFNQIKHTFNTIKHKWGDSIQNMRLDNQPYNFTYSKFLLLNPLSNE